MQSFGDLRNLILAIVLSTAVMLVWQFAYEMPRREEAARIAAEARKQQATQEKLKPAAPVKEEKLLSREQVIGSAARLKIVSPKLHGSLSLKGARLDDLTLANYRQMVEPSSPEVILLSPSGTSQVYFGEVGWVASVPGIRVPDSNSVWQADKREIRPGEPVQLTWNNSAGLIFTLQIQLDNDYMFTLTPGVRNESGADVTLLPYGLLNRTHADNTGDQYGILHEGMLHVFANTLTELPYKELREEGKQTQSNVTGWLGITDKYWLTALVPDNAKPFTANFSHYQSNGQDRYQADYLGQAITVAPGSSASTSVRLFAGAKEIDVLDAYAEGRRGGHPIPLFDRAVDFGMLYFLTKPIFLALNYFYALLGNFGLAILLLTVVIKLLMFPLANKSYKAMNQMKRLQPEMMKLREQYADDKLRMNQEVMALYRREKVNPAAGCLPILIQIPVFFALYKVLYVTIEMRHAPFYGWIRDLSAPDPTNIFTLFGLIDWNPPSLLHIGIWPLIMFVTMLVQQKLNPKPTDPVQAKVMGFLPYIFLFILAPFAAGLVIYWAWNNVLSIAQQYYISKTHQGREAKTP